MPKSEMMTVVKPHAYILRAVAESVMSSVSV